MQFSAVEIRFIVTTQLYSTFTNDLKRKYFFRKMFIATEYAALSHMYPAKLLLKRGPWCYEIYICHFYTICLESLLPVKILKSGHYRPASETPFKGRFATGPMVA